MMYFGFHGVGTPPSDAYMAGRSVEFGYATHTPGAGRCGSGSAQTGLTNTSSRISERSLIDDCRAAGLLKPYPSTSRLIMWCAWQGSNLRSSDSKSFTARNTVRRCPITARTYKRSPPRVLWLVGTHL